MSLVAGFPSIAYWGGNYKLRFVRAADPLGSVWNAPVTVDSTAPETGQYPSLAIVNGNPAIAYCENDAVANYRYVRFVRALDATGASWGAPVVFGGAGVDIGGATSLGVVNGNPAIAFQDQELGKLCYVRATDANGSTWGSRVTVDSTGYPGQYPTLLVVNGRPAIAYQDEVGMDLRFVRASDSNGSAWGPPVTPATAGDVGKYASMALVNGNPAISFFDATNRVLRFVRAGDPEGATWGAGVGADVTSPTGQATSLIVSNGVPAISYCNLASTGLQVVRASDVNGTSWSNRGEQVQASGVLDTVTSMVALADGSLGVAFVGVLEPFPLKFTRVPAPVYQGHVDWAVH